MYEWLMCVLSWLTNLVITSLHMCWFGCMCSFYWTNNLMMQIVCYVKVVNTKVVDNFFIFLFIKFHYFRPDGFGVIDFTSLLSAFACALNKSEWLYCLTYLNMESFIGDNIGVVVLLLSFLKYPRTPFLVV